MSLKPKHPIRKRAFNKKRVAVGLVIGVTVFFLGLGLKFFAADIDDQVPAPKPARKALAGIQKPPDNTIGLWDGPILYRKADSKPIHLILVEKAIQKLHLYQYDGSYRLIKSYPCGTGKKNGKKEQENDDKTPEGIYFNVKTYRDSKITIFGDRAFGLNYPDVFDNLDGNRGNGIFIHGSNKAVEPLSTNGCIVMDNRDLSDLDKRIQIEKAPVIIGERLPYRFEATKRDLAELIPFLKQAMIPEQYTHLTTDFRTLTILGFEQRVVAMSEVQIKAADNLQGFSRLYLAGPGKNLLVLVKREWNEEKLGTVQAKAKPQPDSNAGFDTGFDAGSDAGSYAGSDAGFNAVLPIDETGIASLVESWRKAWEDKKLEAYIAYYHPAFRGEGKDLAAWKSHKDRLNKRYRKISVNISSLKVKAIESGRSCAYFKQAYRSDSFRSDRYKRLEFMKKDTSWKIFREQTFTVKPADWPT